MDPVTGALLLATLIVGTLGATGCSGDKKSSGGGSVDDTDDTDSDTDTGTGIDTDIDTDTGVEPEPDPWERDGFNGFFYQCEYSNPCSIIDIDPNGEAEPDRFTIMTGHPTNRKGRFDVNPYNTLGSPNAHFSPGYFDFLGAQISGQGQINPVQAVKLSSGWHLVPSYLESGGSVTGGLVSLMDPQHASYSSSNVMASLVSDPQDMMSGVFSGGMVFVVGTTGDDDGTGLLKGFAVNSQGYLVTSGQSVEIPLSGRWPSAVEMISEDQAAVLNTQGVAGASVDIVNLADGQLEASIPLGSFSAAYLYEMPVTDDRHYAVVVGVAINSSDQPNVPLMVVDIAGRMLAGSTIIPVNGEARDVEVMDYTAYVSMDTTETKGSSGKVVMVDFSDPSAPEVEKIIDVGYDAGAISVHGGGTVFVVVTDRWWEEPGTAGLRWSHLVAFHPDQVTEAELEN